MKEIELRYRLAQAVSSISSLCHNRRIRFNMWRKYKSQVAGDGNGPQTRARREINVVQARIVSIVATYRVAYAALNALDPHGEWKAKYNLQELRDEDNSGPTPQADEVEQAVEKARAKRQIARKIIAATYKLPLPDFCDDHDYASTAARPNNTSRGRYRHSWIWHGRQIEDHADPEYMDQVRAEWAQADAHVQRWSEECLLLEQDMHRTLLALRHRLNAWLERATARIGHGLSPEEEDGLRAYAYKQAGTARLLGERFVALWRPLLFASIGRPEWWSSATGWLADAPASPSTSASASDSPVSDFNMLAAIIATKLRPTTRGRSQKRKRDDERDEKRDDKRDDELAVVSNVDLVSTPPVSGAAAGLPCPEKPRPASARAASPGALLRNGDAAGELSDSELDNPDDDDYSDCTSDGSGVFSDAES
jgi:hypothetical protein